MSIGKNHDAEFDEAFWGSSVQFVHALYSFQ